MREIGGDAVEAQAAKRPVRPARMSPEVEWERKRERERERDDKENER